MKRAAELQFGGGLTASAVAAGQLRVRQKVRGTMGFGLLQEIPFVWG